MIDDDSTHAEILAQSGVTPPAGGPGGSPSGAAPTPALPSEIGSHQILRRLGEGGSAVVYEGRHSLTHRRAAIKVLSADPHDADAPRTIWREVGILERLRHPNVVELLGHGELPSGGVYLVFELIDGPTLKEVIDRREKVDWLRALDWMRDAALALDAAWSHHIIHRDIKPANMIISPEGRLMVGDFGLAKSLHERGEDGDGDWVRGAGRDSGARTVMGTPRYISPEMGLGQSLDFRADMYSLGATFYHVFVGQAPFDAPTARELVIKHASLPPPPPHAISPGLPDDICDILMKLLRKAPEDRYQSYGDLIADLREARLALLARYQMETLGAGAGGTGGRAATAAAEAREATFAPASGARAMAAHSIIPHPSAEYRVPDVEELEDKADRPRRIWFLALTLLALGGAAILYMNRSAFAPSSSAGGDGANPANEKSWVARQIEALLPARNFAKVDRLSRENQDAMQRLMDKLIRFEVDKGHRPNTLRDAVAEGYATEAQFEDAYGNRMAYDPNRGALTSAGPNREEGDGDDFELNMDRAWELLPESNTLRAMAAREAMGVEEGDPGRGVGRGAADGTEAGKEMEGAEERRGSGEEPRGAEMERGTGPERGPRWGSSRSAEFRAPEREDESPGLERRPGARR